MHFLSYRVTTDSKHHLPISPNVLQRNFTTQAPNKVWVSDITYLATQAGWLCLTVIIDLFSRMVVGWALSGSLSHQMVVTALKRAIRCRQPGNGLIFHSDRGVQFACTNFRNLLEQNGFIQSMSGKGACWDNAAPYVLGVLAVPFRQFESGSEFGFFQDSKCYGDLLDQM